MRDLSVTDSIKERAEETYKAHNYVNSFIIGRKLGVNVEIVRNCLLRLGYTEKTPSLFVLKGDSDKTLVKESKQIEKPSFSVLEEVDISQLIDQEPIQQKKKIDYSGYRINDLRNIATDLGIKNSFGMNRNELIKKIKPKFKLKFNA